MALGRDCGCARGAAAARAAVVRPSARDGGRAAVGAAASLVGCDDRRCHHRAGWATRSGDAEATVCVATAVEMTPGGAETARWVNVWDEEHGTAVTADVVNPCGAAANAHAASRGARDCECRGSDDLGAGRWSCACHFSWNLHG